MTDIDNLDDFWIEEDFAAPKKLKELPARAPHWEKLLGQQEIRFHGGGPGKPYINSKEVKNSYSKRHTRGVTG